MTDSQTWRYERLMQDRLYDVQPGSERARELYDTLRAELDAIWNFIPRQDALRLEVKLETLTGCRK